MLRKGVKGPSSCRCRSARLIYRVPEHLLPPPHDVRMILKSRPKPQIVARGSGTDSRPGGERPGACALHRGRARAGRGTFISKAPATACPAVTEGETRRRGDVLHWSSARSRMPGWSATRMRENRAILGKISAAHPKVAPYPFTTLHPIVGVVDFPGASSMQPSPDIPGLIEGAPQCRARPRFPAAHRPALQIAGACHRHERGARGATRSRISAKLREELKLYDPALTARPWLVVANKMDLPGSGGKH